LERKDAEKERKLKRISGFTEKKKSNKVKK